MIFADFGKALAQTRDPAFRGVVLTGVGCALLLLIAVIWGIQLLLPDTISLPFFGEIAWLSSLLSGFTLFATLGLSVFLMIPVASLFSSLMLDRIAGAVERKHYAGLGAAPSVSLWDTAVDSLRFFVFLIFWNIVALVIYLSIPFLAPVIFWIVNGLLLGREYFQLVAMRWLGRAEATRLRRKHLLAIWGAGTLMAIPLSVPILNLLVPVYGVATFTHFYHRLQR